MPTTINADFSQVDKLFEELRRFQDYGVHNAVERGSEKLTSHLKTNVAQGKQATGASYPAVKDVTMERAIAYGGPFKDTRIRGEVSSNRTAMNVTGQSLDSIYKSRRSNVTEIGFDDNRAEVVFRSNAKGSGSKKPVRDPLGLNLSNVTDIEFGFIADAVEDALERVISGL